MLGNLPNSTVRTEPDSALFCVTMVKASAIALHETIEITYIWARQHVDRHGG